MANTYVVLETTIGKIEIELYMNEAPITCANFLEYVKSNFYTGTIFHRIIDGFMAQGGGFDVAKRQKPTRQPIKNEAGNGLKNVRTSVAMARTSDPDSATCQFFINLADNGFLDRAESADGVGYAVFGHVTQGMDFVQEAARIPVVRNEISEAWPTKLVAIRKAFVVEK
jgi:peptidyl-prolyl cis-trans isomerase A (cyclophilin A)